MKLLKDLNLKSIVYGMIISTVCILLGFILHEIFYPLSAIGLLYAGYSTTDIKQRLVS